MSASNSSGVAHSCAAENFSTRRAAAAPSPAPIAWMKPMKA